MEDALAERFWDGCDIEDLVRERAAFIDGFLCELWHHWFEYDEDCALFAVGGYGRGELHPQSDIDLLIVIKKRLHDSERIGVFIRLLWDLRLEIGHSVRTVAECKHEAANDLSVMTALLERRLLIGSPKLAQKLDRTLASRFLWPSRKFFNAKLAEQNNRHEHYSDIEYGLEPNLKSSPGGLRDIQTIGWITNRHIGTSNLNTLTSEGFLTERESETLLEGREFLWRVRFALHLVSKRKDDQLFFEYQREIASRLDYEDSDGLLAVEAFMRDYYRRVLELREVNDILIQHFTEAILAHPRRGAVEPLNDDFRIRNNYIETTDESVFKRNPAALMEMFVIMANRADIRGVRANTIRQIRQNLDLIDDDFRFNPEINKSFLSLLKSPYTVVSQLTRMRRYGILGAYIPAFGRIIGQMQHDLFHVYTVDAHTMALIRNLRRMCLREYEDLFPFPREVVTHIPHLELLFIAGLFHDIGKGRGGNHSALGAVDAGDFCKQLGLPDQDRELVMWLVQHHLLMSKTSQREEPSDPEVVHRFATIVETPLRLHYLTALTAADMHATNPKNWDDWHESLLTQLYRGTLRMLQDGSYGPDTRQKAEDARQQETAVLLEQNGVKHIDLESLWLDLPTNFVLANGAPALAKIATAIKQLPKEAPGLVTVDGKVGGDLFNIFVFTDDRPNLFADCVAALDQLHLNVMSANIATSDSGKCYDSFVVMENDAQMLDHALRIEAVQSKLMSVLEGQQPKRTKQRRISRQLKQFHRKARVSIDPTDATGFARIEIITADRPGLLALISELFVDFHMTLHQARIQTLGERAEDIFLISTEDPCQLSNEEAISMLSADLTERINAELPKLTA